MKRKPISSFFNNSGSSRKKTHVKPKSCPTCTYLNTSTATKCLMCNYIFSKPTTTKEIKTTTTATATTGPATTGPNAFSFLMAKAAERPRREYFTLHQDSQGTISWLWKKASQQMTKKQYTNIGGTETKWTTTCILKDSCLDKPGTIFVSTNISSGTSSSSSLTASSTSATSSTTSFSSSSTNLNKDRTHWFSPSHLKSALQNALKSAFKKSL